MTHTTHKDSFSGTVEVDAGIYYWYCMLLAKITTAPVLSVLTKSQGSLSYSD